MLKNSKALRRLGAGVATVTIAGILPVVAATAAFAAIATRNATINPTTSGASSLYNVFFTETNALTAGTDTITIAFPSNGTTSLPPSPASYSVSNGGGPSTQATAATVTGTSVTLTTPVSTTANTETTVTITGAVNGSTGTYTGNVSTSKTTTPVNFQYTVTAANSGAPTVTGVNPFQVPANTPTPITITGTGFATGATPRSSVAADTFTNTTVVDANTIRTTITTPAGDNAVRNITVDASGGPVGAAGSSLKSNTALGLVPETPTRVLDTRAATQTGSISGPLQPGSPQQVVIAGAANVPTNATAVVLNVTETSGTVGNLRVYSADQSTAPGTSTVNYQSGQDVANGVIVPLGTGTNVGRITLQTFGSSANVILDVVGYFQGAAGQTFTPAGGSGTPNGGTRIADSRISGNPIAAGGSAVVTVPNAVAGQQVVVNVTAIGPTGIGNLRTGTGASATSAGSAPSTSTVNYIPGVDKANLAVVTLGPGASIGLFSFGSSTNFAVDFLGTLAGTAGPAQSRLLDTRNSASGPLVPGTPQSFGSVAGATTVILGNLTSIQPTGVGNIRSYPETGTTAANTPVPNASSVNFIPRADVANFVVIPVGLNGRFDLQAFGSTANAAVDLLGGF